MILPPELRKRLSDELHIAVDKVSESASPNEKLYYFSVFFGEAVRVLNWHWDEELVLLWAIVQHTHTAMATALARTSQGERIIALTNEHFDSLTRESRSLVDWIDREGDKSELCEIACRLAELIYATTGNGFYLLGKGHFTLAK